MDMVSVQNYSFSQKTKLIKNGCQMNGSRTMTNGHDYDIIKNFEIGHSEFMKIQRYEDLIGNNNHGFYNWYEYITSIKMLV